MIISKMNVIEKKEGNGYSALKMIERENAIFPTVDLEEEADIEESETERMDKETKEWKRRKDRVISYAIRRVQRIGKDFFCVLPLACTILFILKYQRSMLLKPDRIDLMFRIELQWIWFVVQWIGLLILGFSLFYYSFYRLYDLEDGITVGEAGFGIGRLLFYGIAVYFTILGIEKTYSIFPYFSLYFLIFPLYLASLGISSNLLMYLGDIFSRWAPKKKSTYGILSPPSPSSNSNFLSKCSLFGFLLLVIFGAMCLFTLDPLLQRF